MVLYVDVGPTYNDEACALSLSISKFQIITKPARINKLTTIIDLKLEIIKKPPLGLRIGNVVDA
jgi:hypothetical protein